MRTIQLDYKNIGEYKEELTLCLGYFDGIHIGHQKVISDAVKDAKYKTGIMTFDKPVSTLIENGKSKETLTSLDDRFRILTRYNLDYYFVLHIDRDFLNLTKDDFIELLKKLNVKELFVGDDYHFGKNAEGKITSTNWHTKTKPVLSETEILEMKRGKILVWLAGKKPIITNTIPIDRTRWYKKNIVESKDKFVPTKLIPEQIREAVSTPNMKQEEIKTDRPTDMIVEQSSGRTWKDIQELQDAAKEYEEKFGKEDK